MVSKQVVRWFQQQREQGFSRSQLIQMLRKNGYDERQIREVLIAVDTGAMPPSRPAPSARPSARPGPEKKKKPSPGKKKPAREKPVSKPGKPRPKRKKPPQKRPSVSPRTTKFKLIIGVLLFFIIVGGGVLLLMPDLLVLPQPSPATACLSPEGVTEITESRMLCGGEYQGAEISIDSDNVILDCNHSTLTGSGTDGSEGISIAGRDNVEVRNCIIKGYTYGIIVKDSSNVLLSSNEVKDNKQGVYLKDSSFTTLLTNQVQENQYRGVWVNGSSKNFFSNNKVSGSKNGIMMERSSNNRLFDNKVVDNSVTGLVLKGNSSSNVLVNNQCCNNTSLDILCEEGQYGHGNQADSLSRNCKGFSYSLCSS